MYFQWLNQWLGEDAACQLCSSICSLWYILSGCEISLSPGWYTWGHNQVLKCLAAAIEDRLRGVNSQAALS